MFCSIYSPIYPYRIYYYVKIQIFFSLLIEDLEVKLFEYLTFIKDFFSDFKLTTSYAESIVFVTRSKIDLKISEYK